MRGGRVANVEYNWEKLQGISFGSTKAKHDLVIHTNLTRMQHISMGPPVIW